MTWIASNLPQEKHIFFDRHGGVSEGKYASLNCSIKSEDNRENVWKNFSQAAAYYNQPLENLALVQQGVSNKAVFITRAERLQQPADGMVTTVPNIVLAIRTADCCPVLFYDKKHQIIGAAHAGWRGALRGILENTLKLMIEHGAKKESIHAALGPCLQQKSFECQTDMKDEFTTINNEFEQFFKPSTSPTHFQFDLEGFVINRLQNFGLTNISASGIDTYQDENYFSFRRNTHRKLLNSQYDYPTHLSTITL